MKVYSPAGDLEIFIRDAIVEEDSVALYAEMGIWQYKIYLSSSDFRLFFSLFFRYPILLFLLKLPFQSIFRHGKNKKS